MPSAEVSTLDDGFNSDEGSDSDGEAPGSSAQVLLVPYSSVRLCSWQQPAQP